MNVLLNYLEEIENGESSVGKSSYVNWVSGGGWMQQGNGVRHSVSRVGSGQNNQNVGVLQRQPQGKPSGAFENVIRNLFEIQERESGERELNIQNGFSLKGGMKINSQTANLLDTIEDLQNGKKGAADRLAKYVDDGMISTEVYEEMIEKYGAIKKGEKQNNLWITDKTYSKHKNTRHFSMTGILFLLYYYKIEKFTTIAANTMETMERSFIRMLIAGPEVSLNGSPTVSPTTAALWFSDPLPP